MVQVVIKALDILELVAQRNGQAISLTEISEELQLNQATAANIIKTLAEKNYLEHIGKKKGYRLGPGAFQLTNEVAYGQNLVNAAKEEMENLTARLNESCILGTLRHYKRYILHVVNSNQDIQVRIRSERSVYETASGRLLLAYLSEKERERFLQQNGLPDMITWEEGSTPEGLLSALDSIRQEGLATTFFKHTHLLGFAVPIYENKVVVAGLSIFLPEYRFSASRKREIVQALREAGEVITRKLS
ncbi:IclR family transcriptional regulator [Dyadobacter sp. CY345]|uniref:IclR family transcriptional regulator n=1 Tax=Dyadobacter sp. CY345 TaxID=2909335 RepID=UPI001F2B18A0|nr:IclR family transcriptional regulator [Dyadobacter sp. CY345]MCF2446747.1 IclR family transcriptional regulator [Dyadobacter sp. CY345]